MFWSCFLFTLLLSHKVLFHWFSLCVCVCVQLWLHRCDESLKADSLARYNTTAGCPTLHLTYPLAPLALLTSHPFSVSISPALLPLLSSSQVKTDCSGTGTNLTVRLLLNEPWRAARIGKRVCEEMKEKAQGGGEKNIKQGCLRDWSLNKSWLESADRREGDRNEDV